MNEGARVWEKIRAAQIESGLVSEDFADDGSDFSAGAELILHEIFEMLVAKNRSYGNSALEPLRVFSKASAKEQLLVRIDDKLSRLARGGEFPGDDTIRDLIGYLVLLLMARQGQCTPSETSTT